MGGGRGVVIGVGVCMEGWWSKWSGGGSLVEKVVVEVEDGAGGVLGGEGVVRGEAWSVC